ncbi:MAG: hypothetical protein HWD59_04465 [Coxiellaceae bacterium]|nr:MAG: hypothetical protein HWD59_04465 [Coxiellaceae bacterium]
MLKAHELFNMSLQLASQFAITAVPQFIKAMRNKENELSTNRGGLEIVDYFEVFTLKNLPVMLGDRGSRLLLKTGTKETGFDSDVILFLWLMTHSKILKNSTIHLLSLNEEVGRLYTQEESQPVSIELSMELALTVSFIIQKLSQKY